MKSRTRLLLAWLCSLACLSGMAEATVFHAPVYALRPEDEVQLTSPERTAVERIACLEWPAVRREMVVTYRLPWDQSLQAKVYCHGIQDSEGRIPVNEIRCTQEMVKAPWRCELNYSYYRIDHGKLYVLVEDPLMTIEVPGEPPERFSETMAAILAAEPQRLDRKSCELPRYQKGVYEIVCEGVSYSVKRTCDAKGCRRVVLRR